MGNSASQLPFSIDSQVGPPHDHNGWALHEGKATGATTSAAAPSSSSTSSFSKAGTKVSVFVAKKPTLTKTPVSPRHPSKMQLIPAYHHYQNCRKLRHPHILQVLATLDTDNPTAATTEGAISSNADGSNNANSMAADNKKATGDLIIVTEPCVSLDAWLASKPSNEELAWGLESIVRGLHFLHNDAKLVHGNVNPTSFYVTMGGDVKLWNFSLVTAISADIGPSRHFQEWEAAITPDAYRSPERVQSNWNVVASISGGVSSGGQSSVHGMDSYGLGILMDHYWNGSIPQPLQKATQRLQTPNLKMRPRLQPLLKCPVFDTPYQKIQLQLSEILVQPVEQKVALWQRLLSTLQTGGLKQSVAVYKVLPLIQNSIITICNNEAMIAQDLYRREVLAMVLPLFFIAENFLKGDEIGKNLGQLVGLLFVVKDRAVRGALLNNIQLLADSLDKHTLNGSVFEPMCSGFADSSPALRELTLKSTLLLVPQLSPPNLEKLSRYLIRLQSDNETSIRTNTVIFIGKLAPYLPETSQQKLLLPAYIRSMKDPFTPCRLAALQSAMKTKDQFQVADIASKVLPAVTPLLLDPMPNVRAEAFGVVDALLVMLRQESERMATIAQEQAKAAAAAAAAQHPQPLSQQHQQLPSTQQSNVVGRYSGTSTTTPAVAQAPSSGGSYLSGLSSWMTSSTKPETESSAATRTVPPMGPATTTTTTTAPLQTTLRAPQTTAVASPPIQQFSSLSMTPVPAPAPPIADDGWGDEDDGWGDDDDGLGEATAKPSMGASSQQALNSNPFSADQDDPFASIGAMSAKTVAPRVGGRAKASGTGMKLVVPKKKQLVTSGKAVAVPAPATKLKIDDTEIEDGWDDF